MWRGVLNAQIGRRFLGRGKSGQNIAVPTASHPTSNSSEERRLSS